MAESRAVGGGNDETRVHDLESPTLAGATLCGRYRLERPIGSGGMAQVWESTDLVLGRPVAVKVLHPHLGGDPAFVTRFRQEAVAAARLSNPGIVGVYDTCSDGAHQAIVMELLDATTLRQHIDANGPLDADTTVRIALRLLDALEAAHRSGLVHRDVKPSNVLLCRDGRVKIADFGIAKAEDLTELTQEGTLIGTASYLAPEQLLGDSVDARTDLYSLGIVLYECLTGRIPFHGDTGAAVAIARLHADPVDPRRYRADVPPRVAAAVMRSLERRPEDRFDAAADLRAALLDTGVAQAAPAHRAEPPAPPAEPEPEPESFARSERRWLFPALFILLIAAALTVAWLLVRETELGSPGDPAPTDTAAPAPAEPERLDVAGVDTYDPQGRGEPGENDELAPDAVDGDATTAWATELYDTATFFGSKNGVGLSLRLEQPSEVTGARITGSTNGWSGQLYVLASEPDGEDIEALTPVAEFTDVRGPVEVELDGTAGPGSFVVLWITDLGEPVRDEDPSHRVEITDVTVTGRPAPGA